MVILYGVKHASKRALLQATRSFQGTKCMARGLTLEKGKQLLIDGVYVSWSVEPVGQTDRNFQDYYAIIYIQVDPFAASPRL